MNKVDEEQKQLFIYLGACILLSGASRSDAAIVFETRKDDAVKTATDLYERTLGTIEANFPATKY